MRFRFIPTLLVGITLHLTGLPATPLGESPKEKTLYERMGGYDMIAQIVDDLLPKLGMDPKVGRLVQLSGSSRMRNRQLIVDQICEATGGPCLYIGRTMEASHQGLGVTKEDWQIMMGLFKETLVKFKIGKREQKELVAFIDSLQKDIVQKEEEPGK